MLYIYSSKDNQIQTLKMILKFCLKEEINDRLVYLDTSTITSIMVSRVEIF